jgi:transcriptional regulator with XRE-family HTH domain
MKTMTWAEKRFQEYQNDPEYITAEIMVDITEQFCRHMARFGISQSDLAIKLGVKQPFISRLLNLNQNTSIKTIVRVASALDLSINIKLEPKNANEVIQSLVEFEVQPIGEFDTDDLMPKSKEGLDEKQDALKYAA